MTTPDRAANKKRKKYLVVTVILVLLFAVAPMLYLIWEDRAYNLTVTNKEVFQILNGDRLVSVNSTVIIESYIPFFQPSVTPRITERFSNKTSKIIANDKASLVAEDIEIDSITISQMYGSEEIWPTFTVKNPETFFTRISPFGMSKTTIVVNWRYNITQENLGEVASISFTMTDDRFEYSGLGRLTIQLLSYSIFFVVGYVFSSIAFGKTKLREAYDDLPRLNQILKKNGNDKRFEDLHSNLKKLVAFPKKIGAFKKYVFAISILIFKITINNKCKNHLDNLDSYEVAPYKRAALKKTLDKYTKQSFEKIQDSLPELKTILVAITFLASIGISFSWNIGAATSALISLGLFYLFINIGSTLYFVGKSSEEFKWTIVLFVLAVFVILFPILIELSRHAF